MTSFSLWSQSSFGARIAILRRWYNLVIENIEELSHILTLEQGKVLAESKKEILYGASRNLQAMPVCLPEYLM